MAVTPPPYLRRIRLLILAVLAVSIALALALLVEGLRQSRWQDFF